MTRLTRSSIGRPKTTLATALWSTIGWLVGIKVRVFCRHPRIDRLQIGFKLAGHLLEEFRFVRNQIATLTGIRYDVVELKVVILVVANQLVIAADNRRTGSAVVHVVVGEVKVNVLRAPGSFSRHSRFQHCNDGATIDVLW